MKALCVFRLGRESTGKVLCSMVCLNLRSNLFLQSILLVPSFPSMKCGNRLKLKTSLALCALTCRNSPQHLI